MAYIGSNPGGTDTRLFEAVEYGIHTDNRQKSTLATTNGVLLVNGGTTMLPMINFNFALIAPNTGCIYSGETVTTGFHVGGSQIKLCKPGCRPRFHGCQKLWSSAAITSYSETRYINRFIDGTVWISATANSRSGTQISWPTAGTTLPRGIRYVTVLLVGAGGGGGGAGGSLQHSASGGGGGASIVCCIRLPENGNAVLTIGGWGNGGTNYGPGSAGGYTRVAVGNFWAQAGGGAGGETSTSSSNTAAGGSVTYTGWNADGYMFAYTDGGSAPGKNKAGNEAYFSVTEYASAPENSSLFYYSSGGASGGSSGGGGGGASAYYGEGGAGGNGQGYGGGGGGGGVAFLQQHAGGRGAPGYVEVRY